MMIQRPIPWIIVVATLLLLSVYVIRIQFTVVAEPSDTEILYAMVAQDFNLPQLCAKIQPNAGSSGNLLGPRGTTSLRSSCFYAISVKNKNIELCSQVKPLGTFLDPPLESEALCRQDIRQNNRQIGTAETPSPVLFKKFMNDLGYTDEFIALSSAPPNRLKNVTRDDYYSYYLGLAYSGDSEARNDFIQKVLKMLAAR